MRGKGYLHPAGVLEGYIEGLLNGFDVGKSPTVEDKHANTTSNDR